MKYDLESLRKQLAESFDPEELRLLWFDLSLKYPSQANSHEAVVRDTIEFCIRRGKLSDLTDWCKRERPHLSWDFSLGLQSTDISDLDQIKERLASESDQKQLIEAIQPKYQPRWNKVFGHFLVGAISLFVGICGNLLSGFLQNEMFQNIFTWQRILITLISGLLSLVVISIVLSQLRSPRSITLVQSRPPIATVNHAESKSSIEENIDAQVYCSFCGEMPGNGTACISVSGHKFVASSNLGALYCSICGVRPGHCSTCSGVSGHKFVS